VAISALRIYDCGLHRAFYIKENQGERIYVASSRECSYQRNGKKRGEKIYQKIVESTAFAEKCVTEVFACAVTLRETKLEAYLIRIRKGKSTTKNKIIKIGKGKDKGVP